MPEKTVTLTVTPREHQLLALLRDLPSSPLRDLVDQLVRELVAYAREPRCPEMQADGVPCASPSSDCEQCRNLGAMLLGLREAIARPRQG